MISSSLVILAQSAQPQQNSALGLLMPVLLIVMFYFMLIRPQRRQQKEHMARLSALQSGDEVVAAGGIHGLVTNVSDKTVTLKIADGVKIKVEKNSVAGVIKKSGDAEVVPTEVVPS